MKGDCIDKYSYIFIIQGKMKLLFVGYLHGFGGAEKMQINLANAMAEKGHEVLFISLAENNLKYTLSEKVKYKFIKDKGKNKMTILLNRYFNLKALLSSKEHDLSVHFWLQSAYMCAFMSDKIANKTIYCERSDPYDKEYSGFLGKIRNLSFKRIRGFVFQSKGARNYFGEKVQNKSCIIFNPVFIKKEDFQISLVREKRIVTVGRLHEQKNQKLLIEAIKMLPSKYDNYIIEIYGDGPLEEELQKLIIKYNLSKRIILRGTFKDIHKRIVNASLFILTSDYEGMPNALMEAMALGLPCISTDCRPGGAKELIKNKENGIIIPCNDKLALVEAIKFMLENQSIANKMGEKAKEIIDIANPEQIYKMWEKFFKSKML